MIKSAIAVGLLLASVAGPCQGQQWTQTGGPGAGIVLSFTSSGGAVFAGTQGAVYKSVNSGLGWAQASNGLPSGATIGSMAATSWNVFAGTQSNKLWRSSDGGQNWVSVSVGLPQPGIAQVIARGEDLFVVNGQNGLPGNVGSLFVSTNQGDTWTPIATPSLLFTVLPEQQFLFASTAAGIIRADGNGSSWGNFNTGLPISGLVRHMTRLGGTLLVETGNSVYRSVNDAQNWTPSATGLASNVSPIDFAVQGSTVFLAAQTYPTSSVYRSTDNGLNWQHADAGLPPGVEGFPRAMGVSGSTMLVGMFGGASRSTNLGQNWTSANSGMVTSRVTTLATSGQNMWATTATSIRVHKYNGVWSSSGTGLPTASVQMMGLAAVDASTVYVGTSNSGVFKSADGGQTWAPVNASLPQYNGSAGEQYREMAHLAADGTTIYGGTGFGTEFFNQAFQISGGGVVRTTNGGASWQTVNTGFPIIAFNLFNEPVFDPVTGLAVIDGAVFAGTSTRGPFRLAAGGTSWVSVAAGFPLCGSSFPSISSFVKRGSEIFATADGINCFGPAVWKSVDGGFSWTQSSNGLPPLAGASIKVVGKDLVVGLRVTVGSTSPVVFRSTDGGASWLPLGTGIEGRSVTQLAVLGSALHVGTQSAGGWVLGPRCYADCDGAGGLTPNDFQCFLNAYVSGQGYANCDGVGGLTGNDFQCFLNAYVSGCAQTDAPPIT